MFITKIFNRLRYGKIIGVSNKQVACYRKNNGDKFTYTFLNPGNKVLKIMDEHKVPCDNSITSFRTLMDGEGNVISNSSITRTPYHYPDFTPNRVFGIKNRCESGNEVKYVITCVPREYTPNGEPPSGNLYYEKSKTIYDLDYMGRLKNILSGVCSAK